MKIVNIEDLRKLIKQTRKEQMLTQSDLAIAANVGIRFIVDLEKGKETVQLKKVLDVCKALGLIIDCV